MAITSLAANRETYRALSKFITTHLADSPFTLEQLHAKLGGELQLHRGDGVYRGERISETALYDRLTFLTQIAITSARPRVQRSLAYDVEEVRDFVTKGAFYRTFDDHYVWDSGARWYWDERVSEARLWNAALQPELNRTTLSLAIDGQRPRSDGKGSSGRRKYAPSYAPLSRLPEGVVMPPPHETDLPGREQHEADQSRRQAQQAPSAPQEPAESPVREFVGSVVTEVAERLPQLHTVHHEPVLNGHGVPEPTWQVLANDGEPGGTIVLQSNDHVIVATISTVVNR